MPAEAAFCGACGTPVNPSVVCYNPNHKSKIAAGLFGILLGWAGVHRFYLGYTGLGIVQILVSIVTFGIGGLWGFVEGILILTGSFNKDAKGNPMRE
jgi:TM2 domain-containing membrane protein YozV